jgi:hypothetical protein
MFCGEIDLGRNHIKEADFAGRIKTYHHHHRVLLLLVEHRASMKSFQSTRSPAIPLTSSHDLLMKTYKHLINGEMK